MGVALLLPTFLLSFSQYRAKARDRIAQNPAFYFEGFMV